MHRLAIPLLILSVLAARARADGDGDRERSKLLWRAAVAEYDLGNVDGAIAKFEEAYRLDPNPSILFNLGQAYRQKQDYERAVDRFRTYLREGAPGGKRARVQELIRELDGLVAAQRTSSRRPPEGVTAPEPTEAPPPSPPAPAPPVPVAVAVPRAAPRLPPARRDERRWYQDPLGWSLVATGVVAAGAGTGLLVHAHRQAGDAAGTVDQADAQALHESATRAQLAGGLLAGAGAALVLGGVIELALHGQRRPVTVVVGAQAIGVAGRF